MTTLAVRGKRVPDLMLVMDTDPEKKPEFRVQCEVELDDYVEARAIYDLLYDPATKDVTKAHKKIKDKVDKLPKEYKELRQIIDAAFKGNGSTLP
jgi:hypothetical protein